MQKKPKQAAAVLAPADPPPVMNEAMPTAAPVSATPGELAEYVRRVDEAVKQRRDLNLVVSLNTEHGALVIVSRGSDKAAFSLPHALDLGDQIPRSNPPLAVEAAVEIRLADLMALASKKTSAFSLIQTGRLTWVGPLTSILKLSNL